jgi:hypothetical protein
MWVITRTGKEAAGLTVPMLGHMNEITGPVSSDIKM